MKRVCPICPHACALEEGQLGACHARVHRDGAIVCANYGRITALSLDPIEKKPFARFHPGSMILSAGSYGCNMHCPFCQNSAISTAGPTIRTAFISPETLVRRALALRDEGNIGLALTYNEPLIAYEYVRDCGQLAHAARLLVAVVSNGYICETPWQALLPDIDAANIDLKAFTERYYTKLGGDLATVKRTIALAAEAIHLEVTTLIVPGENDGDDEMRALAAWLASVRVDIPLHITRFFPRHLLRDRLPTQVAAVQRLANVARESLSYVYVGNC